MDNEQFLELIKDVSFFKDFSLEEKEYLASTECQVVRYFGSEAIISEGAIDSALYILLRGTVAITKNMSTLSRTVKPRKAPITKLKPGSVFGEISLISRQPRTTNVSAEGETIVLRIDGDLLNSLNSKFVAKFQHRLIEILVKRLDDMNNQLIELTR